MSRNRTATNILEARGAFKKNPNRARPDEPESIGPFPKEPPEDLTDHQLSCWHEVVRITPAGVLTGSDTLTVETIAILLAEFRNNREMEIARLARMTMLLDKIGCSPSGRAKLTVQKPKKNEFDDV